MLPYLCPKLPRCPNVPEPTHDMCFARGWVDVLCIVTTGVLLAALHLSRPRFATSLILVDVTYPGGDAFLVSSSNWTASSEGAHPRGHSLPSSSNRTSSTQTSRALPWQSHIDIVLLWSGLPTRECKSNIRCRYNGELPYTLRSIVRNLPWVHRVYILVNPDPRLHGAMHQLVPRALRGKLRFVDRCTIMPKGTCPTYNSFSASQCIHHIPGLSEHIIYAQDDVFIGQPVSPSFFFTDEGKPYVWRRGPDWGSWPHHNSHRIYEDQSKVAIKRLPQSVGPMPHFWYPALRSVLLSLELQYPEYVRFVYSHWRGRWSSRSGVENSQEEEWIAISMWELLRTGKGVFKNIEAHHRAQKRTGNYTGHVMVTNAEIPISKEGFMFMRTARPVFCNINDDFSSNEKEYHKQLRMFHDSVGMMFPDDG